MLRGGSAAERTNAALVAAMRGALADRGIDPEAIQTVDDFGRDGARELMQARGIVDVLVPRGSAQLIETVVTESLVPVIETGAGVVHIVLDESAPLEWARDIVVNAKMQRPSVCNAVETVLVHRGCRRPPRSRPSRTRSSRRASPCTGMCGRRPRATASSRRPTRTGRRST